MRSTRTILAIALVVWLSLGMTACAEAVQKTMEAPQSTLSEARRFQNRMLEELMASVPPESIIGGMEAPTPRGKAMSCNLENGAGSSREARGILLPGAYDALVSTETEADAVLDAVQSRYGDRADWVLTSTGEGSRRQLELVSSSGYRFFLEHVPVEAGGVLLSISSFSPCFEVPTGFDVFDEY